MCLKGRPMGVAIEVLAILFPMFIVIDPFRILSVYLVQDEVLELRMRDLPLGSTHG